MRNPKNHSDKKLIRRYTIEFFTNGFLKFSWNQFTCFRGVEDRRSLSSHIMEIERHCLIYETQKIIQIKKKKKWAAQCYELHKNPWKLHWIPFLGFRGVKDWRCRWERGYNKNFWSCCLSHQKQTLASIYIKFVNTVQNKCLFI